MSVQLDHRVDGQGHERPVLVDGQARRSRDVSRRRPLVGVVPPGDDDVVSPGEEGRRGLPQLLRAEVLTALVRPHRLELGVEDRPNMGLSPRIRQVFLLPVARGPRKVHSPVELPVLPGQDLEEIGDPSELRDGVVELISRDTAHEVMAPHQTALPLHQPSLLRRGRQQVVRAEGAGRLTIVLGQLPGLRGRFAQRAGPTTRHRPHLRTRERVDLLDGAVGQFPVVRPVAHFGGSMNSRPPR